MLFMNTTETIGKIILSGSNNVTGSLVGTLILILIFLMAICIMFGIPLEFSAILVFPYILVVSAYYSSFMLIMVLIIVFLVIIIAKNFLFR